MACVWCTVGAAALRGLALALVFALVGLAAACGAGDDLIVASTTSVRDTGLLDELVQEFKERNPDAGTVKPIGAGSGQLAELARRGEVDVIISHWPEGEAQLIAEEQATDRRPFMYNFFVVVGPADDPAGVAAAAAPVEAFRLIAEDEALFISRGDGSGTNVRELAVWEEAGIDPMGRSWYQESGAGQGASLLVASDKGAYTLVDNATWTVLEDRAELTRYIVDSEVPNLYSVLRVNPERHAVNEEAALAFADFLTSPAGQAVIEEFGREQYGEALFVPGSPARNVTPSPVSTP
jgi:tungstate transport system substrate-binding protein